MDMTREQAIAEVMAETGEPYEIVADLWDALVSMHEEEAIEAADEDGPCVGVCAGCAPDCPLLMLPRESQHGDPPNKAVTRWT